MAISITPTIKLIISSVVISLFLSVFLHFITRRVVVNVKKVSFTKIAVTFAVIVISVTMCVSPSWAASSDDDIEVSLMNLIKKCLTPDVVNADEDQYVEALQYIQSVWRTSLDKRKKVDYEVLNSVYSRLIVQGVPCEIVTSRGAAQGYYIKGTGDVSILNGKGRYSIKGSYFSDTSGNIFCADLPDNGKTSSSVPSTSAPTVSENTNTTYVPGPSSDLSVLTPSNELQALKYINQTAIHIANETHRIIETLGETERYVFRLYLNVGRVIDGLNSIISGVYRQADLLAGYLPRLDDTVNRLTDIRSASWASVDVENRILSSSTRIGSLLSSVVQNGQLQVNTSPLEARLDKLISMYSKVNSVVLDTASVNGGQITGAVGGELKDVVFWGMSNRTFPRLSSAPDINYTLNGAAAHIPFTDPSGNTIILRSVSLGSSIPSYISNDSVLLAGVWRSGSTYIISDTLDTSTGVYTQRIKELTLTGSESGYSVYARSNGSVLFYRLATTSDGQLAARSSHFTAATYGSAFSSGGSTSLSITSSTFVYANGVFRIANSSLTSVSQWTTWLKRQYAAGTPVTFYYVDAPSTWTAAPVSTDNCMTIAIPEGNSTISVDLLRITGKYETYDSYTQTADIIAAINNLQVNAAVELDLTPLSTRLDTLNTAIATVNSNVKNIKSYTSSMKTSLTAVNTALTSVIADGLLKIDNSAVVTALGKLDKLDELPIIKAAVDGVNTTIASVISEGRLKVDNSPVVTWLETINTTLTTNGGHSSTVDLSTIETTLSKICDKLDDAAVNVNNTVVNITNDNDKFNVFYITDVNGETQPITEFAGDLTGASGKLLSLLYRLVFADALGGVDDDFSGFEDFFTSQEPVTATQGVDDTVSEVVDVWAS